MKFGYRKWPSNRNELHTVWCIRRWMPDGRIGAIAREFDDSKPRQVIALELLGMKRDLRYFTESQISPDSDPDRPRGRSPHATRN